MRGTRLMVAFVATFATCATFGCSSGDARRPARAPLDAPGRTATTSAALTTTTVTTQATTPKSAPASPTPTTTASAVMRVTTERCDRLVACKQVGTGRTFGDRDECFNVVGREVVAALPDDECSSGVDPDRLAACVSEVQANACESGADSVASLPSCTRDRLCRGDKADKAD